MKLTLTPDGPEEPANLTINATISTDALDGSPSFKRLDWGDGTPYFTLASDQTGAVHAYSRRGTYEVQLVANDVTIRQTVIAGSPYPVSIYPAQQKAWVEETLEAQGLLAMTSTLP